MEVYVLFSEGMNVHNMSMQGLSNGTEQWCPAKGGACILEVSISCSNSIVSYPDHPSLRLFDCSEGGLGTRLVIVIVHLYADMHKCISVVLVSRPYTCTIANLFAVYYE